MTRRLLSVFSSVVLLCLAAAHAQGQTALIDWSRATTATNPDSNGNYWNSLGTSGTPGTDLAATVLNFSDGTASPWSVAVDNPTTSTGFGGNAISGPAGPAPFDQTFATTDGIFSNTTDLSTIMFSGLLPDTLYDFSAIGGRASNGADGILNTTVGTGPGLLTLLNDGTVLDFSIMSDMTGSIAFTFADSSSGTATDSATFNAISITQASGVTVPEPSTIAIWAIVGLAALGCACVRRQRSNGARRLLQRSGE